MSNYVSLADIIKSSGFSQGAYIEVNITLASGVSASEIRYYKAGDETNIISPDTTAVSISKYGTYYFYLTDGTRTSDKVSVNITEAKQYSISLEYFSATLNITCSGPASGASIKISGPNSWTKTIIATSATTSFTVPYAGNYTVVGTYSGINSNTSTIVVSAKGATYTGAVKFIRLSISVDSGSAVVLENSSGTIIKSYTQGSSAEMIYLSATDTYTATATLSGQSTSSSINCSSYADFTLTMAYRALTSSMLSAISSAVSAGNLNNVSWSTISSIADALESTKCIAADITEAKKLLGLYKTTTYNSTTVYCHIVGVCQDYLNSTVRGFTFWVTATATPLSSSSKQIHITSSAFGSSNSNSGGWGGTNRSDILRTALQDNGSIYKNFASDLKSVIKQKTTYYGPNYNSTSADVSSITDYMFLFSAVEVWGQGVVTSWWPNYRYYGYEGTGASHNEQYQLFANNGIATSNYSQLCCSNYWWLRSCLCSNSSNFLRVDTDGNCSNNSAARSWYVSPAFCI